MEHTHTQTCIVSASLFLLQSILRPPHGFPSFYLRTHGEINSSLQFQPDIPRIPFSFITSLPPPPPQSPAVTITVASSFPRGEEISLSDRDCPYLHSPHTALSLFRSHSCFFLIRLRYLTVPCYGSFSAKQFSSSIYPSVTVVVFVDCDQCQSGPGVSEVLFVSNSYLVISVQPPSVPHRTKPPIAIQCPVSSNPSQSLLSLFFFTLFMQLNGREAVPSLTKD